MGTKTETLRLNRISNNFVLYNFFRIRTRDGGWVAWSQSGQMIGRLALWHRSVDGGKLEFRSLSTPLLSYNVLKPGTTIVVFGEKYIVIVPASIVPAIV